MASVLDLVKHYQHAIEKYPDDEQKILKCIDKLFHLDVTVGHLQETGVGRTVNALRKEPGEVGQAARSLVYKWKRMVAAEESDQEGDHNDSSNYNGHGQEKDSDDNIGGSRTKENTNGTSSKVKTESNYNQMNGDHSSNKRKYQNSEEEDYDRKRSKHKEGSSSKSYEQKPIIKKEPESSEDYSSETDTETSEEDVKPIPKIKTEPIEQKSKHSYSDHERKSESTSKKYHDSSKHKSESQHLSSKPQSSEQSSNKYKSSSDKETSSERRSEQRNSDKDKKHKEESRSSKHNSSSDKITSEKSRISSDKHKSSEKHASKDRHDSKSHKSEKHKSKSSSEKEISSNKHKSSSSSKEKHSSSSKESSKDKTKESSSTSKEKLSHSKSEKHSNNSKPRESMSDKSEHKSSEKSRHKSNPSSSKSGHVSSRHKEGIPKKKSKSDSNEDSDEGIGCESGASFAEALGMVSPAKPKKKPAAILDRSKDTSPTDSWNDDLSPASLLAPTAKLAPLPKIEISSLPEISTNYKPRPPPKFLPHFTDEEALSVSISSKNQRTKVYSGNKVMGKIPSLYELCVHVLQEHIDALEYTGGVPYEILKPVVDKATPQQLFMLEHYNPYLMDDTDHLWQAICEKHFRSKKRQEMETWREMYMRCQEEQDSRLKSLTENIKIAQEAKKAPIKQTKMAYVESFVKPPRNIARKQAIHGTAHLASASPAARVSSLAATPGLLRSGGRAVLPVAVSTSLHKPKKAPLMQKALQFMRGRKR